MYTTNFSSGFTCEQSYLLNTIYLHLKVNLGVISKLFGLGLDEENIVAVFIPSKVCCSPPSHSGDITSFTSRDHKTKFLEEMMMVCGKLTTEPEKQLILVIKITEIHSFT